MCSTGTLNAITQRKSSQTQEKRIFINISKCHATLYCLNWYKMEPNKLPSFLPKISDVEWKLEVLTNTPGAGPDNLLYTVVLKTNGEDVCFTCGTQQLQDLVYKLKDLLRHCETVKNELG